MRFARGWSARKARISHRPAVPPDRAPLPWIPSFSALPSLHLQGSAVISQNAEVIVRFPRKPKTALAYLLMQWASTLAASSRLAHDGPLERWWIYVIKLLVTLLWEQITYSIICKMMILRNTTWRIGQLQPRKIWSYVNKSELIAHALSVRIDSNEIKREKIHG